MRQLFFQNVRNKNTKFFFRAFFLIVRIFFAKIKKNRGKKVPPPHIHFGPVNS